MGALEHANQYIKENQLSEDIMPVFHVTPPIGWMNDPNGFSYYQDKIHLFYQFHPYSKEWGPMHWGHCVSDDFIRWERLPVAIAPENSYDDAGCFSGSAMSVKIESKVNINEKMQNVADLCGNIHNMTMQNEDAEQQITEINHQFHLLAYTGVMKDYSQNQCLAVGDGKTYRKLPYNPVITGDMLPENFSRVDFRDPKIWKEDDGYYMMVGNKTLEGIPQVVLFHSPNLKTWHFEAVLASAQRHELGTMWECPDFFELDGKYVLMASPQDMCADTIFHNGNNAVAMIGSYHPSVHQFHKQDVQTLDDGLDFYAPQSMLMQDGRRIMIAWMQSWDSNIRPVAQKWSCMMTLPRELHLVDGKIIQMPVREIENYYVDTVNIENQVISDKQSFDGICGRILDMTVEVLDGDYSEFTIHFAHDERFDTKISYDKRKNQLELDRTYSGMSRDTTAIRKVQVRYSKDTLKLRILLDKYSAEIFVNDGTQVLSTTLYTPLEAEQIMFECDGSAGVSVIKHAIAVQED